MYQYDEDTQLTNVGAGRYEGRISARWNVGPVPNGGYVLAFVMAAIRDHVEAPDPLSVTAHYLRPSIPGAASLAVETVKVGRTYTTVESRLSQGGKECVRVLGTYGDLEAGDGPLFVDAEPPGPAFDDARPASAPSNAIIEIANRFEMRLDERSLAVRAGGRDDKAELRGWIRFADGRPVDVHALGLIADSCPPPVFGVCDRGWVPTLELTVHFRARPRSDWLNCFFRTRFLFGGLLEEDGEIWDETGQLVALCRQLAGAPRTMG